MTPLVCILYLCSPCFTLTSSLYVNNIFILNQSVAIIGVARDKASNKLITSQLLGGVYVVNYEN